MAVYKFASAKPQHACPLPSDTEEDPVSYDLMVFDPTAAPRQRHEFLAWYTIQVQGRESHGYNDPAILTPALRAWFDEMIETFPPLNGPLAGGDPDDPKVAEYCLGRSMILAGFAWSEADAAYDLVKKLARSHGVGFFDLSGEDGDIWWPTAPWKLSCEARGEIPLPPDSTFRELLTNLDAKANCFYILEHDNGKYIQCGGSPAACTVELRVYDQAERYIHCVIGRAEGSREETAVTMSQGVVHVQQNEVLNCADAAELFGMFLAGTKFPARYLVREKELPS